MNLNIEDSSESGSSFCFVLKQADEIPLFVLRREIVKHITTAKSKSTTSDLVVLFGDNATGHAIDSNTHCSENAIGVTDFCVRLCDSLGLFPSSFTTFLGIDDSLIVIQLCLAEKRKLKCGIFDVDVTDVLSAEARLTEMRLYPNTGPAIEDESYYEDLLTNYKNYQQHIAAVDRVDVYRQLRKYLELTGLGDDSIRSALTRLNFILLHVPQEPIEKLMLKLLTANQCVQLVEGSAMDGSDPQFVFRSATLDDVFSDECSSSPLKVTSTLLQHDRKQAHMERVMVSFLRLLTNTRDEIALATALCNMGKIFSHEAFSELKRMAKAVGLPMYQISLTLVRRMKLGGKGYALDPSSPIIPFLPDIIAFNAIMNKLQTVVEEYADLSNSIGRIIRIIREHAKRSCDLKLKDHWDAVASDIEKMVLDQASYDAAWRGFGLENGGLKIMTAGMVGQQTLTTIRKFVNKYGTKSCFQHQTDLLAESCLPGTSSQSSPVRFPSLLSQFRSPESVPVESECPKPTEDLPKKSVVRAQNILHDISNKQVAFSPKTQVHSDEVSSQSEKLMGSANDICCSLVQTPFKIKKTSLVQRSVDAEEVVKRPMAQAVERGKENVVSASTKPRTKRTLDLTNQTKKQTTKRAIDGVGLKRKYVGDGFVSAKAVGTTRKKQLGIIKGQQLMTKFFRV